jgi:hypothetical protein
MFKCRRAGTAHEFSGTERLVFAVVTINLPLPQTAAGIDNPPARTPENPLHFRRRSFENQTASERSGQFGSCRKSWNERAAATARCGRVTVGIAAVVANVISAVYRRGDSTVAFFFHRAQKIARVSPAAQSWLCDASRVEAALKSETGLLWRVIKRADNEVFAGVPTGTPRQFFIFVGETLDNFRPRNVRARCRKDRQRLCCNSDADQSWKKSSAGPPSKTWIGSFSYSYS